MGGKGRFVFIWRILCDDSRRIKEGMMAFTTYDDNPRLFDFHLQNTNSSYLLQIPLSVLLPQMNPKIECQRVK